MKYSMQKIIIALLCAVIVFASCSHDDPQAPQSIQITTALLASDVKVSPSYPRVAVASNGDALAVWQQVYNGRDVIMSARYSPTAGWGSAQPIAPGNIGSARDHDIAIDPKGNAVVVWEERDSTDNRYKIWAAPYSAGIGWGSPGRIDTNISGDAVGPMIAVDDSGNATAVWLQTNSFANRVWASKYTPAAGWGQAILLQTDTTGLSLAPRIAIDKNGNALASWVEYTGVVYSVRVKRYHPAAGWEVNTRNIAGTSGYAETPDICFDPSGNAVAVWSQMTTTQASQTSIWTNRYTTATGWAAAELLETNEDGSAYAPRVAVDGEGNAMVVWMQPSANALQVWWNRYDATAGWRNALFIQQAVPGDNYYPRVAIDQAGHAISVWTQFEGGFSRIQASFYDPIAGWSVPQAISSGTTAIELYPEIAMNAVGSAIAVWEETDTLSAPTATVNVWARRFP
jgi:hypothetical protein